MHRVRRSASSPSSTSACTGTPAARAAASGAASGGIAGRHDHCHRAPDPGQVVPPRFRDRGGRTTPRPPLASTLRTAPTVGGVHRHAVTRQQQADRRHPAPAQARRPPPRARRRATPRASAHLERGQGHQRAENAEDVEPNHHGGLRPAQLLEVVMQRRHPEHPVRVGIFPPPGPLEPLSTPGLQHHRHRLGHEHAADQHQEKLGLEQDRHRAEAPRRWRGCRCHP